MFMQLGDDVIRKPKKCLTFEEVNEVNKVYRTFDERRTLLLKLMYGELETGCLGILDR